MAEPTQTSAVESTPPTVEPATPAVHPSGQEAAELEAEADDHQDDADSALGDSDSFASSTTSIGSSILKHRVENGRTYHAYKDGKYLYPNDESENDRLGKKPDLMYDGKLMVCPVDPDQPIHRVLDVGTGTGIWAIDYGDEHPEATVLGVDLSPIQPAFTPPNVSFEIDDIEEPWTFTQKFDYIHARMMTGSIAAWPRFFQQAYENLVPGGYIELTDCTFPIGCDDGTFLPTHALHQWSDIIVSSSTKIGRGLNSATTYKGHMEETGFTDIHEINDLWPLNKWPKNAKYKDLGVWNCENLAGGLSGLSMALFTRVENWSMQEVETFLVDVRKNIRDTKIHSYLPIRTIYARKPK